MRVATSAGKGVAHADTPRAKLKTAIKRAADFGIAMGGPLMRLAQDIKEPAGLVTFQAMR
jgi:hypothetical protein